MIETTDYSLFRLRDDNRRVLCRTHINALKESIEINNQLYKHPIRVTEKMEIINGQHRYMAAKELGVPIWYVMEDEPTPEEMWIENMSKQWTNIDYLNLYCKHGYPEYLKLDQFIRQHDLSIRTGVALVCGEGYKIMQQFRSGQFKYKEKDLDIYLAQVWETLDYLKTQGIKGHFLMSLRFWRALLYIFKAPNFRMESWMVNLEKHYLRVTIKARQLDYIQVFTGIYNYHKTAEFKLKLGDDMGFDP